MVPRHTVLHTRHQRIGGIRQQADNQLAENSVKFYFKSCWLAPITPNTYFPAVIKEK